MDPGGTHPSVEDLVFECLERLESEGDAAVEALCAAHPAEAAILRERVALLSRIGLWNTSGDRRDIPERLGDFRLIERLGSGGMGVVYLAEQISLGRPVALKLIRPEQLYFANSRERFRREIDAVARLQHPSIVPIHATGEERGIPYYAMEHVRGASLAHVIDALSGRDPSKLTGRDLRDIVVAAAPRGADPGSDLFNGSWSEVAAKVARDLSIAVQHAHERGVLHRDIKPSNVMISVDGRVVLLDFGLASSATGAGLTRTGSQIGSMPYMSPEQLRAQHDLVGARTDVYAIGVTLYELLSLTPAFVDPGDTEALRARILASSPRPLRELHRGIASDLALVCRTAMQPEPAARYASAAALAADLENVLALRPIAARAPSVGARVASWARRNPARATAATLAFALVVGGPLVVALQQHAANERVAAVNVQLSAALSESERQRGLAEAARATADRNLKAALEAVDTMLSRVGQETLRDVPQMMTVRRTLLEDALGFYTRFLKDREGDAELRRDVVFARDRVSVLHMFLGDMADAERELVALVALTREDALRANADVEMLRTYADVQGRLCDVYARRGAFDSARASITEAIAAYERIPAEERDVRVELQRAGNQDRLADLARQEGRQDEAEAAARSAVAISRAARLRFPDDTRLLAALGRELDRLGTLQVRSRNAAAGVVDLTESVELLQDYVRRVPSDTDGREKLGTALIDLANGLTATGDTKGSKQRSEQALELDEGLVRDFPDVPAYQTDLAIVHLQLFAHAYRAGDFEGAEKHIGRTIDLQEAVARAKPMDVSLPGEMAGACSNLAILQSARGDSAASLASADRGLVHVRVALEKAPKHPQWLEVLRTLQNNRGMMLVELGRWSDAAKSALDIDAREDAEWFWRRAEILERAGRLAAKDVTLDAEARMARSSSLREQALTELARAVELGRKEWPEMSDPDEWTSLREDRRFQSLVQGKGEPR